MALSEAVAARSLQLTEENRRAQTSSAVRIATLIALWYQARVDPQDPGSVEAWLTRLVPALIRASDSGAEAAADFYQAVRDNEVRSGDGFRATPRIGAIDPGVRKSLLAVGPYDYVDKVKSIEELDVSPRQMEALLTEAKRVTTKKVAAASVRHAQAGARGTVSDNVRRDRLSLGWVRVTQAAPCAFCAMLASRGIHYLPYEQDSFKKSDARFIGSGDAKVHDACGCSLKPVYSREGDPVLERTEKFTEMWDRWGEGGGDAALRFRRAYDHFRETGEMMTWEEANEGLRQTGLSRRRSS